MKATELIVELDRLIMKYGDYDVSYEHQIDIGGQLLKISHCKHIKTRDIFDCSKEFESKFILRNENISIPNN